ncbi:LysR family transcriptional regulator [Nocardiopsis flavescens]|uniref:LysR family transcriptional regulator n=1 Tax=Nocardiopsis flavescens TaxID=758803 RepID=UPI00365468CE
MDVELRHLRCLVAISDTGTFTDAALSLGVSQAAVSRGLAALERALGTRLLYRTSREVTPTAAGRRVLARARAVLAEVDDLVREAAEGHRRLRLGHAWSAVGRHTRRFQRLWAERHPDVELHLVRTNTPTAGLAEGACDLAVVRASAEGRGFDGAVVGHERRVCALASDDPWARRRSVRLAEVADRRVLVDRRTGTTTADLWPADRRPALEYTQDIDDWLAEIATGRCVGITAEGTVAQYRRDGVVFRPVRDAPSIPVRALWRRSDPHPAALAAVALLSEVYGQAPPRRSAAGPGPRPTASG